VSGLDDSIKFYGRCVKQRKTGFMKAERETARESERARQREKASERRPASKRERKRRDRAESPTLRRIASTTPACSIRRSVSGFFTAKPNRF
jgi:hypothetical protein